ncbi:hypothetical protein MNV49_000733 [Pseudohyphozyma bogoriensis]|nr:hypothetical protein MNV49_000733 [Pseudohyphozyma bogoriensis]
MRHRLGNKGLSRTTSHRVLMLRNMVDSLIQHERITTTVAKAKEAQKLADQVIGWGKKGGRANWDKANSFLLNPTKTLRPLFTTLASRYANRSGGYTRVHLAGHRVGDRAPVAILELVDNPTDIKYDSAARALGRELAIKARETATGPATWWEWRKSVEGGSEEQVLERIVNSTSVDSLSRVNVLKALQGRVAAFVPPAPPSPDAEPDADLTPSPPTPTTSFLNLTHEHYLRHLATLQLSTSPVPDPSRRVKQITQRANPSDFRGAPLPVTTVPMAGRRHKAGERVDGWVEGEVVEKIGGPISRAKAHRGREARRMPKDDVEAEL